MALHTTAQRSMQHSAAQRRTRVVEGEEAEEVELGAQAVHVARDDLLAVAARHLRNPAARRTMRFTSLLVLAAFGRPP